MADQYVSGAYLEKHPSWHDEDATWKAQQIRLLLQNTGLQLNTICDVGCGSGGILLALAEHLPSRFYGYDVSPQAIAIAAPRATDRISFHFGTPPQNCRFDLAMAIDVFEHVEDYIGFIRQMGRAAKRQLFHIPLDLTAQAVARGKPLNNVRASVGHLHYFTKDTALASLEHAGLVVDTWCYTAGHARSGLSLKTKLARLPRAAAFAIAPDAAVRLLGGYSLLALCSTKQPS